MKVFDEIDVQTSHRTLCLLEKSSLSSQNFVSSEKSSLSKSLGLFRSANECITRRSKSVLSEKMFVKSVARHLIGDGTPTVTWACAFQVLKVMASMGTDFPIHIDAESFRPLEWVFWYRILWQSHSMSSVLCGYKAQLCSSLRASCSTQMQP
ncbi:hypothetical protein MRX96_005475 [Rhipicephalus microplus]